MKIGEVAKEYGLSVDTVNYYVSLGLLVPQRRGSQRVFDERTRRDIEMILELREMEFSLHEIHRVLSLRRVSSFASGEDLKELCSICEEKKNHCLRERDRLSGIAARLDARIAELRRMAASPNAGSGVPLSMLDLLCCPLCGGALRISGADMDSRSVFSGSFKCACGYRADIKDGVLLTPNKNRDLYDKPDTEREMYKNLPPHLISLFQSSYNWMTERLARIDMRGRTAIETHANAWFFMHNHQEYLDPRGKYIVVDKYPETLLMYKKLIERQAFGRDILYIADSSVNLPLKPGCVNLNIDFFAVNEHNFYSEAFLLADLKKYFAPGAAALGTYFYFDAGAVSMKRLLSEYPSCSANNFNLSYFEGELARSGFVVRERGDAEFTTSSGDNIGFSFHEEGERMYLMPYLAEMKK